MIRNKILFVGINPVKGSFKDGNYKYFSNNSYFYTLLKESGFTLEKENSDSLEKYNYKIINYSDYISDSPLKIPKTELEIAKEKFTDYLTIYKPLNIIFLGKFAVEHYFKNKKINFGKINQNLFDCEMFIVPFPTSYVKKEEKIKIYKEVFKNLK